MPTLDSTANEEHKPCRTCVDFKTWTKQQRSKSTRSAKQEVNFSIFRSQQIEILNLIYPRQSAEEKEPKVPLSEGGRFKYGCPLDKDELGRSTWSLLHTMAATYPDKPTDQQKNDVRTFFSILSRNYPCDICAKDLVQE